MADNPFQKSAAATTMLAAPDGRTVARPAAAPFASPTKNQGAMWIRTQELERKIEEMTADNQTLRGELMSAQAEARLSAERCEETERRVAQKAAELKAAVEAQQQLTVELKELQAQIARRPAQGAGQGGGRRRTAAAAAGGGEAADFRPSTTPPSRSAPSRRGRRRQWSRPDARLRGRRRDHGRGGEGRRREAGGVHRGPGPTRWR